MAAASLRTSTSTPDLTWREERRRRQTLLCATPPSVKKHIAASASARTFTVPASSPLTPSSTSTPLSSSATSFTTSMTPPESDSTPSASPSSNTASPSRWSELDFARLRAAGLPAYDFRGVTVSEGDAGEAVSMLQQFLLATGHYQSEHGITGYFGPATRQALAHWQAEVGLPSAGIFGRTSRAAYERWLESEWRKQEQATMVSHEDQPDAVVVPHLSTSMSVTHETHVNVMTAPSQHRQAAGPSFAPWPVWISFASMVVLACVMFRFCFSKITKLTSRIDRDLAFTSTAGKKRRKRLKDALSQTLQERASAAILDQHADKSKRKRRPPSRKEAQENGSDQTVD
eukprot:jgi/Chlat1/7976/Chrsp69S00586